MEVYPHPIPTDVLEGNPIWASLELYERNGVSIGIWGADSGKWNFVAEHREQCHVFKGKSRITNRETGESFVVEAGESFYLEAGFKGIWEVIEPVRKEYLISNMPKRPFFTSTLLDSSFIFRSFWYL